MKLTMRALGIVAVAALPLTSAWSLPTPTSKYVTGNVNPKRRRYQSTRHLSNEAFPTQISNENAALANPPSSHPLDRILNTVLSAAPSAITITAATMATFALNNYFLKLGPVLSSSVIGLLSAIVLPPKLALAALCGSFAGMAKTAVIPGVAPSAALGFICALTMSLFDKKILAGRGRRPIGLHCTMCVHAPIHRVQSFRCAVFQRGIIGTLPSRDGINQILPPNCPVHRRRCLRNAILEENNVRRQCAIVISRCRRRRDRGGSRHHSPSRGGWACVLWVVRCHGVSCESSGSEGSSVGECFCGFSTAEFGRCAFGRMGREIGYCRPHGCFSLYLCGWGFWC
mmetsp:Transcript_16880/g.21066  ORF Transcript_16880/g.21066 Transcript_16880/m.21066 type:complete len:342 (-) Transcript_16880:223-1248(-)